MDYIKRIRNILKRGFDAQIISVNIPPSGNYNKVFIVNTNKGDFVIRFTTEDFHSLRAHAYALGKWADLGIPVPKILSTGKDYVVETKIPGTDWRNAKISKSQTALALKNLGMMLKKMHSVKTKKYGYIIKPGIGQYDTWKEFMDRYLALRIDKIQKTKCIDNTRLKKIISYLKSNEDLLDFNDPRLCHKDMNKGNIMIHEGKISGIIDASDAISGDPTFDVGIIYQKFGRDMFDNFTKSYGKVDMRKVRYYAVINALRKVPLDYINGNVESCERHFKQIEEVVK